MDIKEKSFNIINGPNGGLLFDNCKFWNNKSSNPLKDKVFFVVVVGYTMPVGNPGRAAVGETIKDVNIQGIEHEDGSGHSFNLHGTASFMGQTYKFKAYYNSQHRDGRITLLMQ